MTSSYGEDFNLGHVVGEDGKGISNIAKTGTSGLVDTYTITYSDGTTSTFTVTNGAKGDKGNTGAAGRGISNIAKTGTSGLIDTYTITYSDGTTSTFTVTNGKDGTDGSNGVDGDDGVGIASITKTSSSGLVDTYTITFTDGNTTTFTVTNGSDATVDIVTSFNNPTSDSKVPSEKLVKSELDKKIATSSTTGLVKNDGTIDTNSYATTSSVPTKISDLTNDSDFIETSSTTGLIKNDGSIDTNTYITSASIPSKTSDLTNDGADGTNVFVADNDSRLSDSRTPTSHTHGQIQNDGFLKNPATQQYYSNAIVITGNNGGIIGASTIGASYLKDGTAHNNIGSNQNATQDTINTAIDTALGNKITKSSSATGLLKDDGNVMTSGTGASNWAVGNHTHKNLEKTEITTGTLDDYTDTGWYSYTTSNSANITNVPQAVGSVMEVLDDYGDGKYVIQKVYTLPSSKNSVVWYRQKYYTNGWGSWKKLMSDSDVNALIGSAITYIVGSGS